MVKWLVLKLANWCERTGRMIDIRDRDENGETKGTLYLRRYMVFQSKLFCVYIHRFLKSDDDTHHDHPWNFLTYVVDGGYTEETVTSPLYKKFGVWPVEFTKSVTKRLPGTIAYRRAKDIHRVIVDKERTEAEVDQAPLTVCFIGPRVREWGFWLPVKEEPKKKRWVLWTEFLELDPSHPEFKGHS